MTSVLLRLDILAHAQAANSSSLVSPSNLHIGYFCVWFFMFWVFLHRQSSSLIGGFFFSTLTLLQVHSLKLALEGVEKERDFYFGKLREIELLCQEHGQENDNLVQRLMEVLYASDEHVSVTGPGHLCSK